MLAARGSTQFFLRIYELALQASFRADFTMEQLTKELGLVIDKLWPSYERAAIDAGLPKQSLGTELVLGERMVATAYAKNDSATPLSSCSSRSGTPSAGVRPGSIPICSCARRLPG